MTEAGGFVLPEDHSCLAGHFPGNPVAPGVVLLDAAFGCLRGPVGGALRLVWAKFTAPVRPGDAVAVAWRRDGAEVAFTCSSGGITVLRGAAAL